MEYSLRYQSRRAEVWRWYWLAWRAGLWKIHVLCAAGLSYLVTSWSPPRPTLSEWLLWTVALLPGVIFILAIYPQIRFKSAERSLTLDSVGLRTKIGKLSGSVPWSDIKTVRQIPGALAITGRSGNAMVVPSRAIQDAARWERFVRDITEWHHGNAV